MTGTATPEAGQRGGIAHGALLIGEGLAARRVRRRHVLAVLAVLGVFWLCVVFAGAISDSAAINDRTAELRAATERAAADLAATRRELTLVRSETFRQLQARAYGMGNQDERAFALAADAPTLPPIAPLGSDPAAQSTSPLDDWLGLLFDPGWPGRGGVPPP